MIQPWCHTIQAIKQSWHQIKKKVFISGLRFLIFFGQPPKFWAWGECIICTLAPAMAEPKLESRAADSKSLLFILYAAPCPCRCTCMYACILLWILSFSIILFSSVNISVAVEGLRNQTVLGLSSTTYYYFGCAGPLVVVPGLRLEVSGASLVDQRSGACRAQ